MSNWYDCHRTCVECQKICMHCHTTCEEYQTDQSTRFYNQYRQDHAALTQWILGMHGNPSSCPPPHVNQYTHDPQPSQHAEYTNVNPPHRQMFMREQQNHLHPSANRRSSPDSNKAARYSSTDDESSSSEESSSDASSSYSETSSDEIDSKEEEEALLNPVVHEFEYVPLDRFGEIPNRGRRFILNNRAEEEDREEWYTLVYGDQKSTIKALETIIDLEFCRNCDLTQPFVWPVLPLRMK